MKIDHTINAQAKNVIFGSIVDGENGLYITDNNRPPAKKVKYYEEKIWQIIEKMREASND